MIRITGGEFRGRKIKSPPGSFSRPTIDRVRKALFDILQDSILGSVFLDLYSGVGLVGIEALSRGADKVIFVEKDQNLVRVLKENLRLLNIHDKGVVFNADAAAALPQAIRFKPDIIFLDPPYSEGDIPKILGRLSLVDLKENCLAAAQHSVKEKVLDHYGILKLKRQERYGETMLSFFRIR
jgi:16S rRNA (guanine966-N2)-methyltransferase